MIGKDKSYIKSNEITEVKLKAFRSSFSKDILLCGESITDRQKVSQKCLDYLCDKFKIEKVKLTVLNKPQRKKENGTLKIWENKNSLYGAVYENNVKIMAASFKFADNDATIQRVKEYFGC